MDIPVYLFTGFLGSGKTTFVEDLFSDKDFNEGEKTLLLLCEEGEKEYVPSEFAFPNVIIEKIEKESDLQMKALKDMESKYDIDRVVVEYNGMWMLESLFKALPKNWLIYQEVTFFDAETFLIFNQNMRQQIFNKLKTAELVVFNRCQKGFDKMAFHREVRIANRKSQIIYEYGPDDVEPDTIEDVFPYDISLDEITVEDRDYALWYADINENPENYDGKILNIRMRIAMTHQLPGDKFALGRHVMTCCIDDIQFAALVAKYPGNENYKIGEWVKVRCKVRIEMEKEYGKKGPVLYVKELIITSPPKEEVATFA